MISYQELCKACFQYENKINEIATELRNEVRDLSLYLENNLGLSGKTWERSSETGVVKTSYVVLGFGQNGNFSEMNYQQLPFLSEDKSLAFSILLALEKGENSYPKPNVWVDLKVWFEEENLVFEIRRRDDQESPRFTAKPDDADKFSKVCEGIKQSVIQMFAI